MGAEELVTADYQVARFWHYVDKNADGNCWNWTGKGASITKPTFQVRGRQAIPRRVAWLLSCGTIPAHHNLSSRCKNAFCVNPEHHYIRSPTAEVPRDAKLKVTLDGRVAVRDEVKQQIVRLVSAGFSRRKAAALCGVTTDTACKVVTEESK